MTLLLLFIPEPVLLATGSGTATLDGIEQSSVVTTPPRVWGMLKTESEQKSYDRDTVNMGRQNDPRVMRRRIR